MTMRGYRFGEFTLDAHNKVLLKNGQSLALNAKYFDVLEYLVVHAHDLVTKEQLFESVWRDVFVTDSAITQSIKEIRKVLGDRADAPLFIQTVPKRGYMFVADAVRIEGPKEMLWLKSSLRRPYKFLAKYEAPDRDLFFGREHEIGVLIPKILDAPSMVLYGRSGVGKSSLVAAGLAPELQRLGHKTTLLERPPPLDQQPSEHTDGISLVRFADAVREHLETQTHHWILILDQFESWYLDANKTQMQWLCDLLPQLLRLPQRERFHLLIVIREDCFAELASLKEILPRIYHHEFRLLALQPTQARRAIEEPLRALGYGYEPGLVDDLLAELQRDGWVDPPALQIACDELFNGRSPEGILNANTLNDLGGIRGVLDGYLQRVLRRFVSADLVKVKSILVALIADDRNRQSQTLSELRSYTGLDEESLARLLDELCETRLVCLHRENGVGEYELVHDWVVPSIAPWLTQDQLRQNQARRILHRGLSEHEASGLLMAREALEVVLSVGPHLPIDSPAADYLVKTAMARGVPVPQWLAQACGTYQSYVKRGLTSDREAIRMNAIACARWCSPNDVMQALANCALSDPVRPLQKQSVLMMRHMVSGDLSPYLRQARKPGLRGTISTVVALATLRDAGRSYLDLRSRTIPEVVGVVVGLAWVRLVRERAHIGLQSAIAGLAGGMAGAVVGVFLTLLAWSTQDPLDTPLFALLLALVSSGIAVGLLAGFGLTLGRTLTRVLAARHHALWPILGGGLSGTLMGLAFHQTSSAVARAFWDGPPMQVTGWLEGLAVGIAIPLAYSWSNRPRTRIAWGALGGLLAGFALALFDGSGFANSVAELTSSLTGQPSSLVDEGHRFAELLARIVPIFESVVFGAFMGWAWRDPSDEPKGIGRV